MFPIVFFPIEETASRAPFAPSSYSPSLGSWQTSFRHAAPPSSRSWC